MKGESMEKSLEDAERLKFCRDCKWHSLPFFYRITGLSWAAKCGHPKLVKQIDEEGLVTGESKDLRYHCKTMRGFDCGRSAKFFEPKDSKRSAA